MADSADFPAICYQQMHKSEEEQKKKKDPNNETESEPDSTEREGGSSSPASNLTSSELKIKNAVFYITEGEKNDKFFCDPTDEHGVQSYYIIHHPAFYITHLFTTILLMLLALIEKPSVFTIDEGDATLGRLSDTNLSSENDLLIDDDCNIQSKLWQVISNPRIHAPLEIIFHIFLIVDVTLRAIWLRKRFFTHRTFLIAVVLFVMFVEAVVVILRHQNHIRVTRSLRPLFFVDSYLMSETRRTLRNIANCLREILDVLLVLLLMIAIFAVMGHYLFAKYNPDYFSTVEQSFVSLFITLTTANHPDVMLESYKLNGWSAVFFIIFLVITLYLLTNVLLGVVYGSFKHASKKKFKKKFKHQRAALKNAYDELTKSNSQRAALEHGLDVDTFITLMLEYKPLMPKWQVLCIFKALQKIDIRKKKSGSHPTPYHVDQLTVEEFYNFYEALDFKWIAPPNEMKHNCKLIFENIQDYLATVVKSDPFKIFLTLVVIANVLFLFVYVAQVPSGKQCHGVALGVSFLFVTAYCIEVVLKMITHGLKYFTNIWNWIDLAIIISSMVMLFLEINNCALFFFQPVKLTRILWLKGRYRKIMKAVAFLIGKIVSAIVLLLVVYYFFAIIGMEFFSGVVRSNCCDYNHTWYGVGKYYSGTTNTTTTNVYWLLNFDTNILSSFITLFMLMVVNNWYIVMEGFAAEEQLTSVHHAWLTRLYFMSFYIITLVVLQVSVAFILDAFANARKINKLLSKKSGTNVNSCCCNQMNSELGGPGNKEPKPSIVNAYYDSLQVFLSCDEVKRLDEKPPAEWWKHVPYCIRMWRKVDFKSRKLECQCIGMSTEAEPILKQGYFCTGERERGKSCLDLQLYSEKFPKWEQHYEEPRECGDLFASVCCHMCASCCCCNKCTDEKFNEEIKELCKRFMHFLKGLLEFIFG